MPVQLKAGFTWFMVRDYTKKKQFLSLREDVRQAATVGPGTAPNEASFISAIQEGSGNETIVITTITEKRAPESGGDFDDN